MRAASIVLWFLAAGLAATAANEAHAGGGPAAWDLVKAALITVAAAVVLDLFRKVANR